MSMLEGTTLVSTGLAIALALAASLAMFGSRSKYFDPEGKHCYIGGGSQGLGLALAKLLASRGAHVTIVSRSQKKLDEALEQVKASRKSEAQKLNAISSDLSSPAGASSALTAASAPFSGRCPDYVFSCAGGAGGILGFFTDLDENQLRRGVDTNYWPVAWTAHAAAKQMASQGVRGSIVLTSSILGFFALPGYAAYTPAKHAIRGLAETLRAELLMYGISVHAYFPATILSPGYEEEEKCKPQLTKDIEGADGGLTPEQCAERLVKALEKGEFLITTDPIGHLFRNSMRGIAPTSKRFLDPIFAAVAPIALPVWRRMMDSQVRAYGKKELAGSKKPQIAT